LTRRVDLVVRSIEDQIDAGPLARMPERLSNSLIELVRLMGRFDLMTTVTTTTFAPGRMVVRHIW
jgi:hypothetical protein